MLATLKYRSGNFILSDTLNGIKLNEKSLGKQWGTGHTGQEGAELPSTTMDSGPNLKGNSVKNWYRTEGCWRARRWTKAEYNDQGSDQMDRAQLQLWCCCAYGYLLPLDFRGPKYEGLRIWGSVSLTEKSVALQKWVITKLLDLSNSI